MHRDIRKLTTDELLELICDLAYEQANKVSGIGWFREFMAKVDKMQGLIKEK